MIEKACFKCHKILPLNAFYAHPAMADGHLNKCKECAKMDVRASYAENRGKRSAYERSRALRPERVEQRRVASRKIRDASPEKARAWNAVANALRDGRLTRHPCEVCGDARSQGHHDDYAKPLEVRWLCFTHHREHHGQVVTNPPRQKEATPCAGRSCGHLPRRT